MTLSPDHQNDPETTWIDVDKSVVKAKDQVSRNCCCVGKCCCITIKVLIIVILFAILGAEIYFVCLEEKEIDISDEQLEKIDFSIDFDNVFLNASELDDGFSAGLDFEFPDTERLHLGGDESDDNYDLFNPLDFLTTEEAPKDYELTGQHNE